MTEKEGMEFLRKGDELANKLLQVLQKELGDEVPSSITLYAAAKFTAGILYAVRKETNDTTIEKGFFDVVRVLLGDVVEKSEAHAMQNKIREAEQKLAEHRKMIEELDKEIDSFDKRHEEYQRRIAENEIRLNVIKREHDLIIASSDKDKLN